MSKAVFACAMFGVPNPFAPDSSALAVYTDGDLPSVGRPTELVGATVLPRIAKRPGVNYGADIRKPVGSGAELTITIIDDEVGTFGTLFLFDKSSLEFGLNTNRLTVSDTGASVMGGQFPSDGLYFIENECVEVEYLGSTASATPTHSISLTRGQCGSLARVHTPHTSEGEDGSADRIVLSKKPNWDFRFECAIYLFFLDESGAISSYIKRKGVVMGEPTEIERPFYDISMKLLEDHISEHKIGNGAEISLSFRSILTQMGQGGTPQSAIILLKAQQAELLFNEPCRERGANLLDSTIVSNLNTRLFADKDISWQIGYNNGDDWIFNLTQVGIYTFNANGQSQKALKLTVALAPDGYRPDTDIVERKADGTSTKLKPWWKNGEANSVFADGEAEGDPPKIRLRLKMKKTVVQAALTLCCSRDGSSGQAYDKLIGGIGAGLSAADFNEGTVKSNPMQVSGNTNELLQIDQLLNVKNTYYFDLSKQVSLNEFLTNEFIATQLLLGPLQNGKLTMKNWAHVETPTVTLNPLNQMVKPGKRLASVKRLDLSAGIRIIDLEPAEKRSVRWLSAQNIKSEEVQPIRFWREGLSLTIAAITTGDLSNLVQLFYKQMGGAPKVYEVQCALQDHIDDGVQFADSVLWSDPTIPTPQGLGISGVFFVIGIDLNFDEGLVIYKLVKNEIITARDLIQSGHIAPALDVINVTHINTTQAQVTVKPVGATSFDPESDFDGLFAQIRDNLSHLRVINFSQAPIGARERDGSLDAYVTMPSIGQNPDGSVTATLEINAAFIRGNITRAADLFTAQETKISLPDRVPASASLSDTLIESDPYTAPTIGNFMMYQPRTSLNGVLHTFGA